MDTKVTLPNTLGEFLDWLDSMEKNWASRIYCAEGRYFFEAKI